MNKLKLWLSFALLAGFLTGCGPKMPLHWKEEVELIDGRVVWVERTASAKGMGEIGGPPGISDEHYSLRFTPPGGAPLPEWQGEYLSEGYGDDYMKYVAANDQNFISKKRAA